MRGLWGGYSQKYAQTVSIVTYRHEEPLAEIERYRQSDAQWIVSVGMISEGTDIPRLQVCCHMSSVKTELYFRQVLGRILRVNGLANQQAWLFTFAEQSLIEFSERIEQDIPESCLFAKVPPMEECFFLGRHDAQCKESPLNKVVGSESSIAWISSPSYKANGLLERPPSVSDIQLGRFRKRVISAFSLVLS